jgi:hypothetical protein
VTLDLLNHLKLLLISMSLYLFMVVGDSPPILALCVIVALAFAA